MDQRSTEDDGVIEITPPRVSQKNGKAVLFILRGGRGRGVRGKRRGGQEERGATANGGGEGEGERLKTDLGGRIRLESRKRENRLESGGWTVIYKLEMKFILKNVNYVLIIYIINN